MADKEIIEAYKDMLSTSRRMMLDLADDDEGDGNTDRIEGSNAHEESEDEALGAILSRRIP